MGSNNEKKLCAKSKKLYKKEAKRLRAITFAVVKLEERELYGEQ